MAKKKTASDETAGTPTEGKARTWTEKDMKPIIDRLEVEVTETTPELQARRELAEHILEMIRKG